MWCALGLFLSSQDISGTTEISAAITRFTLKLFRLPGQTYYMYVFDGLRSAAHVGVFLVTSAAIWTAFFVSTDKRYEACIWSAGVCLAFSVGSEMGKLFVPGRHCSVTDMFLNILGCAVGAGIVCALIIPGKKGNKQEKTNGEFNRS